MDLKQELNKFAEGLSQLRDEIKIQLHLAGMETRQEWDNTEKQWQRFEQQLEQIAKEGKDPGHLIDKAKMIGEELNASYQRIKQRLSE